MTTFEADNVFQQSDYLWVKMGKKDTINFYLPDSVKIIKTCVVEGRIHNFSRGRGGWGWGDYFSLCRTVFHPEHYSRGSFTGSNQSTEGYICGKKNEIMFLVDVTVFL